MNNQEPLFKSVFGKQWESLPDIFRLRYANRAASNDLVTLEGNLDIYLSPFMKFLMPLFNLVEAFVPYPGKNVPVTVNIRSKPNSSYVYFERTFHYPKQKACFTSYLQVIDENSVIEFINFGLGWHMTCSFDGNKVVLEHRNYVWKIAGKIFPMTLRIFIGKLYVEEIALSKASFQMLLKLTHPLFGKMFEYSGIFKLIATK